MGTKGQLTFVKKQRTKVFCHKKLSKAELYLHSIYIPI